MKKGYIKPEAEIMEFVGTEEVMTDASVGPATLYGVWDGTIDPHDRPSWGSCGRSSSSCRAPRQPWG